MGGNKLDTGAVAGRVLVDIVVAPVLAPVVVPLMLLLTFFVFFFLAAAAGPAAFRDCGGGGGRGATAAAAELLFAFVAAAAFICAIIKATAVNVLGSACEASAASKAGSFTKLEATPESPADIPPPPPPSATPVAFVANAVLFMTTGCPFKSFAPPSRCPFVAILKEMSLLL
jgi:hypothetical protein